MLFKKSFLPLAGIVGLSQAFSNAVLAPRAYYGDVCDPNSVVVVHISTYSVEYPVVINQYFEHNTIININGGVTIIVNNAPTSVITTVTATTTTTVTSTVTNGNGAVATPFVLAFEVFGVLNKRQVVQRQYVGPGGNLVSSCLSGSIFTITNGQLFSGGEQLSTDGQSSSAVFAVSAEVLDITTTFSESGGLLTWTNSLFFNGAATFCSIANSVISVFDGDVSICNPAQLAIFPASSCVNGTSSSGVATSITSTVSSGSSTTTTLTNSSTTAPATTSLPTLSSTSSDISANSTTSFPTLSLSSTSSGIFFNTTSA